MYISSPPSLIDVLENEIPEREELAGKYPLHKVCHLQILEHNLVLWEAVLGFMGTEHLPKFSLACSGHLQNPQGLGLKMCYSMALILVAASCFI